MAESSAEPGVDRAWQAGEVTRRLRLTYGQHERGRPEHVTDSLIATILSQHTSDRNSSRAFRCLIGRFPTWEAVRDAPMDLVAEAIRPGGLAHLKATRIQQVLREIERRSPWLDLDDLRAQPVQEARRYLESLPGVGPKTAACVLLFACDLPALPVDTHVHRVSLRLGLIPPGTTAPRAQERLERLVPVEDVYDFHVGMIAHGRRVCVARTPRCAICPLATVCDYGHIALAYGANTVRTNGGIECA